MSIHGPYTSETPCSTDAQTAQVHSAKTADLLSTYDLPTLVSIYKHITTAAPLVRPSQPTPPVPGLNALSLADRYRLAICLSILRRTPTSDSPPDLAQTTALLSACGLPALVALFKASHPAALAPPIVPVAPSTSPTPLICTYLSYTFEDIC